MNVRFAAQYIRISTDKQDLSPSVQKEAIAAYAAARGMKVVATYEDEGRSGVHLKNRTALVRLLRDVTESKSFTTVLVYDVSRWGRFQDMDAAAFVGCGRLPSPSPRGNVLVERQRACQ